MDTFHWMKRNFYVPISYHPGAFFAHLFFGHPLKSSAQNQERLGFYVGLPILAIDALSSVAYATEEILIALSVAGTGLYGFAVPIMLSIVLLLAVLVGSYIQTVQAYPSGGGAYIIARNHLGSFASLLAASSLLIDYTLTVAVSVTAGIRALTSSYDGLLPYKVHLSVLGVVLLCWVNLRGVKESAKFVAPFVYIFICMMICLGIQGLFYVPINSASVLGSHSPSLASLLDLAIIPILLRSFASGCTAMTGIEAIANAGSTLKQPQAIIAQRILIALGFLLGVMFLMITLCALKMGLRPSAQESLLSQMTHQLWGEGILHQSVQWITASILFLAANTAFVGAPKLSALLAQDGWLPKQLSIMGDRLVFSKGIIVLSCVAGVLVIVFKGDTHALIPLYAIGVFSAFTLSQAGMVRYWHQFRDAQSERALRQKACFKARINGFGAFLTAIALIVTCDAKFKEGAFYILLIVPCMILICLWIRSHYKTVENALSLSSSQLKACQAHIPQLEGQTVIVPIFYLHKGVLAALKFAREISQDVRVVIVDINHDQAKKVKIQLEDLQWSLQVITLTSPYRLIIDPIINYVHKVDKERGKGAVLVLPETVPVHWWQKILHNKTAKTILKALAWSEVLESQARIIINVPYYLKKE